MDGRDECTYIRGCEWAFSFSRVGVAIVIDGAAVGNRSDRLKFNSSMEFQTALRRRVDDYFRRTGRPDAATGRYTSRLLPFSPVFSLIPRTGVRRHESLAGVDTGRSACPLRDGNRVQYYARRGHRAFPEHLWVNKLAAMTLDLIGASSYVWHWKHTMFHHNYVNITGYDPDIDLGIFARFTPHQKRLRLHRWQHLYLWVLYTLMRSSSLFP